MARKMVTTRDVPAPIFIPKEDRVPTKIVVSTHNIEDVVDAQENKNWREKIKAITEMRGAKPDKKKEAQARMAKAREAKEKKAREKS